MRYRERGTTVTVDLPGELLDHLHHYAERQERPIAEVIAEALWSYLLERGYQRSRLALQELRAKGVTGRDLLSAP